MAYIADSDGGNQVDLVGAIAPYPIAWPVYSAQVETYETLESEDSPGIQLRQSTGVDQTDGRISINVNSVPKAIRDSLLTKFRAFPVEQCIYSPDGSTEFLCTWLEFRAERKTKRLERFKLTIELAVDEEL